MTPTVRATVENALKQARMNLDRRVERPVKEFRMQTQVALKAAKELQTVGNLLEEATRIIITQNGSNFLSQIDNNEIQKIVEESNSVTKQKSQNAILAADSGCIKDDTDCQSRKNFLYRTITGICNNLNSPTAANANAPLRPFLGTQNYNDQISEIRRAVSGGSLPSPRLISNIMQKSTVEAIDSVKNNLIMQFGQMVAHDLVFGPSATGPNGEQLACDDCDSPSPNCAPIEVPADDEYFPKSTPTKKNCISFTRALNGQQGFGPRQPIGQTTHFLDLSIVYGSSLCEATDVRLFADGLLKTIQSTAGTLPPFDKNDTRCQSKDPFFCFKCGDLRSSFHPGLPPLHVMFVIEHNRIAREIKALKPTLNDETIYQTARRIMIAQYQHMVYNEYLPHIIGVNLYVSSKLKPLASGRTKYDPKVDAGMFGEFAAGAFRFGHSQARRDFPRINTRNSAIVEVVDIGNNGFYTDSQYRNGGPATFVAGMMHSPTMVVDTAFAFSIRNQILEIRGKPASGFDLISMNLMRGRDVGFHPYVAYRAKVGLPPVNTFDDLIPQMGQNKVNMLKKIYRDVRDIDLFAGILAENPISTAIVGPTAAFIIAEQFKATKFGDHFYYENAPEQTVRGLTDGELAETRKATLGGMICRAFPSNILKVQQNIFQTNDPTIPCTSVYTLKTAEFLKTE